MCSVEADFSFLISKVNKKQKCPISGREYLLVVRICLRIFNYHTIHHNIYSFHYFKFLDFSLSSCCKEQGNWLWCNQLWQSQKEGLPSSCCTEQWNWLWCNQLWQSQRKMLPCNCCKEQGNWLWCNQLWQRQREGLPCNCCKEQLWQSQREGLPSSCCTEQGNWL